jgi:hypothetical protein
MPRVPDSADVDEPKAILKPYEGDWDMAAQEKPSKKPRAAAATGTR